MSTITADAALLSMLRQLKEVTEIRDASGNLVGIFSPTGKTDEEIKNLFDLDRARARYAQEKDRCRPFSEVIRELERRAEKQG
jgi:hypothetical protein